MVATVQESFESSWLIQWLKPKALKELSEDVREARKTIKDLALTYKNDTLTFDDGYAKVVHSCAEYQVWIADFKKGAIVDFHNHASDEIFVCNSGKVSIITGLKTTCLTTKKSTIVKAGINHKLEFFEDTHLTTVAIPPLSEV